MKFIKSSINVTIGGSNSKQTQFISLLIKNNIPIKNISYGNECTFQIDKNDILKVKKLRKIYGITIRFTKPPYVQIVGFPLVIAFLIFLSTPYLTKFIFLQIHFEGPDELVQVAEMQMGKMKLTFPTLKKHIPPSEELRQQLMKTSSDIAWVLIDRNGAKLNITLIAAPKVVSPTTYPEAKQFIAAEDARVKQMILLQGERLVHRESVVKKGDPLAAGINGGNVQGEIIGEYLKEISFELSHVQSTDFEWDSSHLSGIISQFLHQSDQSIRISSVKVLQVQKNGGKVKGKVLLRLEGNIAKPLYLKETMDD